MALPNNNLVGWTTTLYAQPLASPTPLTTANLGTIPPVAIVTAAAGITAITVAGNQVKAESIPAYGFDNATVDVGVSGSRLGDILNVQGKPIIMEITVNYNPSDTVVTLLQGDAYSGTVDRTFVVQISDGGANKFNYAFNGRVGNFKIDAQPGAEVKAMFTIAPRGNQYGWSFQ